MKKGFVVWNDDKIKVAHLIEMGKTDKEILKETGFPISMIKKVRRALNKGQRLPGTMESNEKASATANKKAPAAAKSDKEPKPTIRFVPKVETCEYTPIMAVARQVAVEKWGWRPDMPFENFIDTILFYFFKDRGIILQSYIDEEELEKEYGGKT